MTDATEPAPVSSDLPADLLSLLVCPESRQPVRTAPRSVVDDLNARIAAGGVTDVGGTPVQSPIGGGLLRADGARLYPVFDGIPTLLPDSAIALDPPVEVPEGDGGA